MSDNPRMGMPDVTAGERTAMIEGAVDTSLSPSLTVLRDQLTAAFDGLTASEYRGELTLAARPSQLVDLLRFCRDDPTVRCELLVDLSSVHWPGGRRRTKAQETTGWPTFEEDEPGRIVVSYVLYSVAHNHRFRISVTVPDERAALPSVVGVYRSADMMEREVYDMFGVIFEGHPNLQRVLMPEDWEGHPLRKDYPLGGVEVSYQGVSVPPPDHRQY